MNHSLQYSKKRFKEALEARYTKEELEKITIAVNRDLKNEIEAVVNKMNDGVNWNRQIVLNKIQEDIESGAFSFKVEELMAAMGEDGKIENIDNFLKNLKKTETDILVDNKREKVLDISKKSAWAIPAAMAVAAPPLIPLISLGTTATYLGLMLQKAIKEFEEPLHSAEKIHESEKFIETLVLDKIDCDYAQESPFKWKLEDFEDYVEKSLEKYQQKNFKKSRINRILKFELGFLATSNILYPVARPIVGAYQLIVSSMLNESMFGLSPQYNPLDHFKFHFLDEYCSNKRSLMNKNDTESEIKINEQLMNLAGKSSTVIKKGSTYFSVVDLNKDFEYTVKDANNDSIVKKIPKKTTLLLPLKDELYLHNRLTPRTDLATNLVIIPEKMAKVLDSEIKRKRVKISSKTSLTESLRSKIKKKIAKKTLTKFGETKESSKANKKISKAKTISSFIDKKNNDENISNLKI